jgi:hypothetical protein
MLVLKKGRGTRRVLSGLAVGVGLTIVAGGGAWAHECYVANRSDQGNASVASHSQAWEEVSLDTILTQFIGVSPDVATCVEELAPDYGVPSSFVFGAKQAVGQGGVIAENNPNMDAKGLSSDGNGIDHAEDAFGPTLGMLIGMCSS